MFRSLFAQIVSWLIVTILITASGVALIGAFNNSFNQRPSPNLFLSEAEYLYKVDGAQGLSAYLQRIRGQAGPEAFMTDDAGRDLVSAVDRSHFVELASHGSLPFVREGFQLFLYERDREGHWFFIEAPPILGRQWIKLWMLGVVIAFCYMLARHLTTPLRSLRYAVERFGKGDLTARVESTRQDELGDLSKTFDRMAERIQSLVGSQGTLLRDISHELRSPLARLSVAVELARSQPHRDKALDQIEREAHRLNVLVGQVLSLARTENLELTLDFVQIHINQTIQDLLDLCAIEAKGRNCRLILNSPGDITVNADEELLRRALENVLRNALRHAPANTDITITVEATNGETHIKVRDLGDGVPPESVTRIFEPFYRVERARDRDSGGTGLGLAIAKQAVESHAGRIHARNLDPGLEVEMVLPKLDHLGSRCHCSLT
jgi:signal transduction histidine kinase